MMQHSVFIVDDEPLIVEGLRATIERDIQGFCVAGSANSGEAALDSILRIKPEIVISDIRMRGMDGLELARNLRQLLPFTQIILLSGYDDFKYAQAAIRSQIFDYLLKPVTSAALQHVLSNAVETTAKRYQDKKRLAELVHHLDDSKPFLRHLLFSNLRVTPLNPSNPILALFNLQQNGETFLTAYIRFIPSGDSQPEQNDEHRLLLFEQVQYILRDLAINVIPFFEPNAFVLLIRSGNEQNPRNSEGKAYAALEKIASMISINQDDAFYIGVGNVTDRLQAIEESYTLAKEATRYGFFFGSGSVISYNDIAFSRENTAQDDWLQQMILSIRAGAKEAALDQLKSYMKSLNKRGESINQVRHNCLHVTMTLFLEFAPIYLNDSDSEKHMCDEISTLFTCPDIGAIEEVLEKYVTDICQVFSGKLNNRNIQIVQEIEEIINKEYATATLETISSAVHMSPAYTSNLFSVTKGITIRDSIINKRIDRAKELLKQTNLKLYEIADKVGYSDAKYFSQVFRKVTGQTPNQYRYN